MAPPYGSGPPWSPGPPSLPGVPPSPPKKLGYAAQPSGIFVGHFGPGPGIGAIGTSAVFATTVAPGNGIVVIVNTAANSTITLTDTAGNVYTKAQGSPMATSGFDFFNVFWCAQSVGANPTITVNSTANTTIQTGYMEIVGASGQWFLEGQAHTTNLTVAGGPSICTYAAGDLIVGANCVTASNGQAAPAGYTTYLNPTFNTAASLGFRAYASGPVAAGTYFPSLANPSGAISVCVLTIRAAAAFPDHQPFKPYFPTRPPWMKVPAIPFPQSLPATSGNVTLSLTGQTITSIEGTILPEVDYALSGQTITSSEGTIAPEVDYFPTAQTITSSEGTLTPSLTSALSGQTATFTEGTLSAQVAPAITGQTATFSEGSIAPEVDYALTQQTATFTEGTITAVEGVFINLTGQTATFTEGTITQSGGTPVGGGNPYVFPPGFRMVRLGGSFN